MPMRKTGVHWYLSDAEVGALREFLNGLRPPEVYTPGGWFVSYLNRKPEALGLALPGKMPPSVVLRDITLRTIEQTPGVAINLEGRKRLARAIVELGVRSIQLALLARTLSQEAIAELAAYIKGLNPRVELVAGGGETKEGIDRLASLGVDCVRMTLPASVATSAWYGGTVPQMAWAGRDWRHEIHPPKSIREGVERNQGLLDHAHKRGLKVEASLNMFLYATEEIMEEFAREMGKAGVDYLGIADGPGGMSPHAVAYAVSVFKNAAPKAAVSVHLHNTFGLGVAVNLAAVQAGADVLEASINGYCCAAGQADIAHLAAALEILYGVDTGIDLKKLTALRRLGEDVSGVRVARNHPITGDEVFTWNGFDAITQEIAVDPLIHWCVEPTVVGNKRKWNVDRTSGPWSMLDKLTELGIEVEKEDVEAILRDVQQELLVRGRSLTDEEIRDISLGVVKKK